MKGVSLASQLKLLSHFNCIQYVAVNFAMLNNFSI
jgi:hypothetical protein